MEKDIIKRGAGQNYVLYEEPEPLFPPSWRNEKRRRIKMMMCAVAVVAVTVGIIVLSTRLLSGGGVDRLPDGADTGGQLPVESEYTESLKQSEPAFESQTESQTVSKTEESNGDTQGAHDEVTEAQTFAQTDVSGIELGEGYVVNYTSKAPDVSGLLHRGFVHSEIKNSPAPLVMVIHTHTGEKYLGEGEKDALGLYSVVSVGEGIVASLNSMGLTAIHCTVIHDGGEQNAYIAARKTIKTMIEIYPSIKYVIDVHRMSLENGNGAPLATILTDSGEAQMRISVSTDVKMEGDWQDDLCLALSLRGELNEDGVPACAPVCVRSGGYNGDLCRFYLTLEVGAEGNSAVSAIAAGKAFAQALVQIVLD